MVFAVRLIVPPSHTGLLLPAVGATGVAFTVKSIELLHPSDVRIKVNVTIPAETPVTKPSFVTVAILVLLLDHEPPLSGVTLVVKNAQTDVAPPNEGAVGNGFITTLPEAGDTQPLELVTVK